jgi:hypothetical protein
MNEFFVPTLDMVASMSYQSDRPADSVPVFGVAIPIDSASNAALAPIVPTRETAVGGMTLPVGEVDPDWCYN